MENSIEVDQSSKTKKPSHRRRNIIIFGALVIVWLIFDILTKQYFDGNYSVGTIISEPILGLFRFHLVHNTGAAWGMFGDSTIALGILSSVVCVIILGYFIATSSRANSGEVIGLGLILAGGIGNGIDRFFVGYVVDFIEFTFIDFPVFNIADIGVTCGFVIFIASMIFSWWREDTQRKEAEILRIAATDGAQDDFSTIAMPKVDSDSRATFEPPVERVPIKKPSTEDEDEAEGAKV